MIQDNSMRYFMKINQYIKIVQKITQMFKNNSINNQKRKNNKQQRKNKFLETPDNSLLSSATTVFASGVFSPRC